MTVPDSTPTPVAAVLAVDGVLLSRSVAEELVSVLSALERLVRGRGQPLPARWRRLRAQLLEASCVGTCVDVSAQVVEPLRMSESSERDAVDVIDSKAAAAILETTEANVRDLCKRGRLDAMLVSRRWWIAPESVEMYRLQRGI